MLAFLNKFREPFPCSESPRERLLATLFISLFIASFLFLFRPFGAHNISGDYLLVCLGFGLVTFLCMTSFDFFVPRVFGLQMDLPGWTLWKWISYTLLMMCWIAFGNIIFIEIMNPGRQIYWQSWLIQVVPQTLAIGIFPIIFYGLVTQMRATRKNKSHAQLIDLVKPVKSIQKLSFTLAKDTTWTVEEDQFLYAQAMQNYVSVMHWNGDKVEKTIVRSTFHSLYKELNAQCPFIEQCHRSFLVNTKAVIEVKGNAQGLRLSLRHLDEMKIPVSRRFIAELRILLAA